jgi:hypothetical protein
VLAGLTAVCLLPQHAVAADDFRIYLNPSCIVADEPIVAPDADAAKSFDWAGFVVTSPGQAIITGIIRGIARAIGRAAESQEYVLTADRQLYLYHADFAASADAFLSPEMGCVTIISGNFAGEYVNCVDEYQPVVLQGTSEGIEQALAAARNRPVREVLKRANVCLSGPPDFFYESRIELSDDATAFRLRGAGLEVNALASARKPADRRAVLLTVSMLEPSEDGRGRQLASNWTNFGQLHAGVDVNAEAAAEIVSEWTRLPPLNQNSLSVFKADARDYATALQEIEALERRIVRQVRQLGELQDKLAGVDEATAAVLRKEVSRLDVAITIDSARLGSWRQEYADLPGLQKRYMPAVLRVSLTETRSEQQLQAWLANFLDVNSVILARHLTDAVIESR